jgi:hypothetical protein
MGWKWISNIGVLPFQRYIRIRRSRRPKDRRETQTVGCSVGAYGGETDESTYRGKEYRQAVGNP